jgi:hypothetical protein
MPTIALHLILMAATMAALHKALRWSVDAIDRARSQAEGARGQVQPGLALVEPDDRRMHGLPFVGQDRRKLAEALQDETAAHTGTTGVASNVKPFRRR